MRKRTLVGLLAPVVLVPAVGCTVKPAEADGAVTYKGQPVTGGIISFLPTAPGGASGGGGVVDGRYRIYPEVGLPPGKYRVEIRWSKPTGERLRNVPFGHDPEVYAEALPAKYHAESVLTAELKPGSNTVDFNLDK